MMARAALSLVALFTLVMGLAGGAGAQRSADCARWREIFAGMPTRTVTIEAGARTHTLRVKSADTPPRQAGGFQCATPEEIQHNLILFDFGHEITSQFHMNNVPAPLDIAFVKQDGRIFSILRMDPGPRLYGPMGAFRYALEARAGFFESQGIRQGEARMTVPEVAR
jgi:uncharacterized membrane protein (UPF0127 family)